MKATAFGFFTAAVFLFASATALADDRGGRYDNARGSDGWRLGERVRGGYAIYHRGHRVPGAAIDIADGWVLGTQRESGGYAIYRWNGRGWDQAPGGAVQIGGSYRNPWVVNNRGQRFSWNGYDWEPSFRGSHRTDFGRGHFDRGHFDRDHFDRGHYDRGHNSHGRGWADAKRLFGDKHRDRRYDHHDRSRNRDRSDRRSSRW